MLLSLWTGYAEDWALQHKVTFDGVAKTITIGSNTSSINVKTDIYSSWKEWLQLRDNGKFLPAIRVSGGDPIGGGNFTGDVYFLINGWRIIIDHSCNIDGVIYSDDYPSPFIQTEGTQIVTNKVSSLVTVIAPQVNVSGLTVPTAAETAQAVWQAGGRTLTSTPTFNGPSAGDIASQVWSSTTRTLTTGSGITLAEIEASTVLAKSSQIPSTEAIADAVRAELTPELTHVMTLESNPGLTPTQATMLLEMYRLMGLDPTRPLVVTQTQRTAGELTQNISTSTTETIVNRV
jgi:hypothetical protein